MTLGTNRTGKSSAMTGETPGWTRRFPGFDVLDQAPHWDRVTEEVVTALVGMLPVTKFFTAAEEACARALLTLLTGQDEGGQNEAAEAAAGQGEAGHRGADLAVPVLEMIDARLEAGETDGWRYADMPEDGQAWRDTLSYLDEDAGRRCDASFADAPRADQIALVQAVQDLKSDRWHGLPADHVWSLWTRYACTAFYAHPFAWDEIGFGGPAYPRGYKNAGIGKLEPFEIPDAKPAEDPVREGA